MALPQLPVLSVGEQLAKLSKSAKETLPMTGCDDADKARLSLYEQQARPSLLAY